MKKLLVIVMALMPSLSILAMNPSGYDLMPEPDDIPITPMPDPFPGHEPRIMSVGATGDNDGGPIDLGLGGVRPRSRQDIDPNEIPIKPCPGPGDDHRPRFRSVVQDPQCYHYDGVVSIYDTKGTHPCVICHFITLRYFWFLSLGLSGLVISKAPISNSGWICLFLFAE